MIDLRAAQDAVKKLAAAQGLVDDVDKRIVAKQSIANVKDGKADLRALASNMVASRALMEKVVQQILGEDPDEPDEPDIPVPPAGSLIELTGRKATDYQLRTKVRAGKAVDTGSIKAALASAEPGDVVMLKTGVYRGNYILAKAGVKITHADPHRLPVMDGKIDVMADNCAIEGLIFEGDTAIKVSLQGNKCRVAGNWIRKRTRDDAAACIVDSGKRNLIEDNLIEDCVGAAIQVGTWAQKPNGNEGWYRRNVIRRMKSGRAQGSDVIAIGLNWAGQNNVAGCVVEQNLIENCEGAGGDIIAQQSSGNVVGANVIRHSGRLRMRGGKGNKLVRNVNEDSAIAFGGQETQAWGNRGSKIEVLAGDHAGGEAKDGTGAAKNCLAAGNAGALVVGATTSRGEAVRVSGLRVEGHQGDLEGDLEGVDVQDDISVDIPDVGVPGDHSIGPDAYWSLEPDEPNEPDEGEWIGGPPGANGRKLIKDQDFSGRGSMSMSSYVNTDFLNCKLPALTGTPGVGNRLLGCLMESIKGTGEHGLHLIYLNNGKGKEDEDNKFVCQRLRVRNCTATNIFEFKGFDAVIADCIQEDDCKIPESVRERHGSRLICIRNKGFTRISVRGYCHWIEDNEGAEVALRSGTYPSRWKDWSKFWKPGDGGYPCAELVYVGPGNGPVILGDASTDHDNQPARRCIIHPDAKIAREGKNEGTDRRALKDFKELLQLGGYRV
jgi:hypothetical protein